MRNKKRPYRYVSATRISAGTPNCSWFATQPHPPTTGRWSAAVRFAGAFTRLRGSVCEFSQTLLLTRVMPASSTNSHCSGACVRSIGVAIDSATSTRALSCCSVLSKPLWRLVLHFMPRKKTIIAYTYALYWIVDIAIGVSDGDAHATSSEVASAAELKEAIRQQASHIIFTRSFNLEESIFPGVLRCIAAYLHRSGRMCVGCSPSTPQ